MTSLTNGICISAKIGKYDIAVDIGKEYVGLAGQVGEARGVAVK